MTDTLAQVAREVADCPLCPRLVAWREKAARVKVRRFAGQEYWGRGVPGFGDANARLLIVGLAPAAHGANRTGRMFTGDRSGDWLYRALHKAGFASQPTSVERGDGLELRGAYIAAVCRCAPPDNKPLPDEVANCAGYLEREATILWPRLKAVVVLGRIAHDAWLRLLRARGVKFSAAAVAFGHGAVHQFSGEVPALVCSYHPSQQNTQTGRLTEPMFDAVWQAAARFTG